MMNMSAARNGSRPLSLKSEVDFYDNRFLMFVLDGMAYEYEKRFDDVIRLTLGKSELPICESITQAMVDALTTFEKSTLVFPAGVPALKERIAEEYLKRHDIAINPDNVIISVGTSAAFRNLFYLLACKDDEVLLPLPYYPLYQFSALLAGTTVKYYNIDIQSMSIDFASLEANFTEKTKIVVVNSPGNPLGNIISKDEIRAIDAIVDGRAAIISDEIYNNTHFDEEPFSAVQLTESKSPLIVTNAFSKAYRMYSRRVGYSIVPDELITPLTVIQHHTLLTTDPVPQFGAIAALDHPEEVSHLVEIYKARRDYTLEKFKAVADVRAIPAKGSFYLTLDCESFLRKRGMATSLELAQAIMEQTHVATVPGSDFGLPDTLRLSYSAAKYNEAIDRLVVFFAGAS
jgi:aspartate/methionine/tyrosine aminotransferase